MYVTAPLPYHSSGLSDTVAGWAAHAAVWQTLRHLPFAVVIVVGILALLFMAARHKDRLNR